MVPKKKKLLATGEAGFVSLESSTPERPVGTFVPALGTPRRSPRLTAKRKRSRSHAESLPQPSLDQSAPVSPFPPSPQRDPFAHWHQMVASPSSSSCSSTL